jgi:uncharacterized RDD family membrane protein YckC
VHAQKGSTPVSPPSLLGRELNLDRRRGPERAPEPLAAPGEPAWSRAPAPAAPPPVRAAPASALPLAGPLPAARATPAAPPLPPRATPNAPVPAYAFATAPVAPPPAAPAPLAPVAAVVAPAPAAAAEVHARPATLWRRLLAGAVDAGLILAVAALYVLVAAAITGLQGPRAGLGGLDGLVLQVRAYEAILLPGVVLTALLALVYCAVAAFLWNGRTLGRRLLGLRLVDTHGLAPAPTRAVLRALLAGLSFALFLGGFWLALFDRRGQTLHDKLTSTFVVQPS